MSLELLSLADLLGRVNTVITQDRTLTTRAIGILLFGKEWVKNNFKDVKEVQSPTDVLLNETPDQHRPSGIEFPNL